MTKAPFFLALSLAAGPTLAQVTPADESREPTTTRQPATREPLTDATISRLLDESIDLSLTSQALPDVLAAISQQTGVPFEVPDETYQRLPYGANADQRQRHCDASAANAVGHYAASGSSLRAAGWQGDASTAAST